MINIDPIIIYSTVFLGGIGLVFGVGLGFAAKKFAVHLDPREETIFNLLPGSNCGACGYPGCGGYAAALIKGAAEPGKCNLIANETNKEIARLLGKEVDETSRKIAVILGGVGKNC